MCAALVLRLEINGPKPKFIIYFCFGVVTVLILQASKLTVNPLGPELFNICCFGPTSLVFILSF